MIKTIIRIIFFILLIPAVLLIIYEFILFALCDFNIDFIEIDRCLDHGGKWNYSVKKCDL